MTDNKEWLEDLRREGKFEALGELEAKEAEIAKLRHLVDWAEVKRVDEELAQLRAENAELREVMVLENAELRRQLAEARSGAWIKYCEEAADEYSPCFCDGCAKRDRQLANLEKGWPCDVDCASRVCSWGSADCDCDRLAEFRRCRDER